MAMRVDPTATTRLTGLASILNGDRHTGTPSTSVAGGQAGGPGSRDPGPASGDRCVDRFRVPGSFVEWVVNARVFESGWGSLTLHQR